MVEVLGRKVASQDVLHAVMCIPRVVACRPGQIAGEGVRQVVERPGEDYDVVHAHEGHDYDRSISNACSWWKGDH